MVLVPHGHSTPTTAQFIAAQPPTLCPILEYLIKWNEIHQFFFANPLKPVDGMITVPESVQEVQERIRIALRNRPRTMVQPSTIPV